MLLSSSQQTPDSLPLTIHLEPGFGWLISEGRVAFGPGSVFRGFVRVQFSSLQQASLADQLRIVFYAFESVPLPAYEHGIKDQLFGTQHILWQQKLGQGPLDASIPHDFPFVIQIPMIQYPPSIVDMPECLYQCRYKLSAYLESKPSAKSSSKRQSLAVASEPIFYMPFIEARTQKPEPLVLESSLPSLKTSIRLCDLEYLPDDIIPAIIHLEQQLQKDQLDQRPIHICMKLHQIVSILPGKPQQHQQSRVLLVSEIELPGSASGAIPLNLRVPDYLPPSFDFGHLSSIRYKLSFRIKRSSKSSLKQLLATSPSILIDDIPIRIGSFGYGLQAPEELRVYSEFKPLFAESSSAASSQSSAPLPVPSFVVSADSDSQEEKLPAYEPYHLPSYDQVLTVLPLQLIC